MRLKPAIAFALILVCSGCTPVEDESIPNMPVNISLGNAAAWNTYGVAGFGTSRRFILDNGIREPSGFPYTGQSATGFGGVLLINGMDPYTVSTDAPLAYDLACPVERERDVRIEVEGELYHAVCPRCGSTYDVTMAGGAPLSGPAAQGERKLALRRYRVMPSVNGGYLITN